MIETQPREIARGKTKILTLAPESEDAVDVLNLEDITAGDGARKEWFPRKGEYSTQTNHYAMTLLASAGIPVAYSRRTGPNTFRAIRCDMLPYEVVAVRRVTAKSSILKRNPDLSPDHVFEEPETALFLKTSGFEFKGTRFEKNDPFITASGPDGVFVCRPDLPVGVGNTLTSVPAKLLFTDGLMHPFGAMHELVRRVFVVLENAWRHEGCVLCDLKIEFGLTRAGQLVVADVIDNDSWRLLSRYGVHLDKQPFRDGDTPLAIIAERYREVAERIVRFKEIDGRALLPA